MPGAHAPTVHQLKIGLQGAAPPLWRRIQVPSEASLGFLHDVIQETFGWEGYHLHRFEDERGREWGETDRLDGGYGAAFADEEEANLGKILRAEGTVRRQGPSGRPAGILSSERAGSAGQAILSDPPLAGASPRKYPPRRRCSR